MNAWMTPDDDDNKCPNPAQCKTNPGLKQPVMKMSELTTPSKSHHSFLFALPSSYPILGMILHHGEQ
jgi:hypothetical protein